MFWYRFLAFSPKHLARNCTLQVRFRFRNMAKEGKKRAEGVGFSYPKAKSYTRNYKVLLGFPIPGVGNVGDFQKTFGV